MEVAPIVLLVRIWHVVGGGTCNMHYGVQCKNENEDVRLCFSALHDSGQVAPIPFPNAQNLEILRSK